MTNTIQGRQRFGGRDIPAQRHSASNGRLTQVLVQFPVAVRPTSEAVMYDGPSTIINVHNVNYYH
jgi:hypothetical protein